VADGFAGMGEDGRALLVHPIRHISSKQLDPLSFAVRPDRKERISRVGALGAPLLGLRPLGGHGAVIHPFCITILYHNLLLFIDIFHI
jgi:hypothetical protein